MPRPFDKWTVLPHGKLSTIDDNIRTVVGTIHMPLMDLPRRMTVVALADSRLIVWSAIALDEDEMAELEASGRLSYLIVPSDKHRLDARIWKQRYPALRVVAPEGARANVAKVVPVDTTAPRFDDASVEFTTVAGTDAHEAALVVRGSSGTTLVLNDVVGNIRDARGVGGWLLRLAGFAGDKPQIPKVVKKMMIKDAKSLRAQLLMWAEIESLKRILVSHGAPIETNARATLRDLAASLE
jgi:hypothetical protein